MTNKTDTNDWVCEIHPWEEMGHSDCKGAGVLKDAQMWFMMIQLRNAQQELKELKMFYGDIVSGLYDRVIELEQIIESA